jgi:hypothetical protein
MMRKTPQFNDEVLEEVTRYVSGGHWEPLRVALRRFNLCNHCDCYKIPHTRELIAKAFLPRIGQNEVNVDVRQGLDN